MPESEYNPVRIKCGFRIDAETGEKLPLTAEQEAWGDKMLDRAFQQYVQTVIKGRRRRKSKIGPG